MTDETQVVAALAEVLWRAEKDAQPHSIPYADTFTEEPYKYRRILFAQADAVLASDWLAEHVARHVSEALEQAADALTWVRPEVCPCEHPEACCGSEAACDAMRPSTRVVGAPWLRERARLIREGIDAEAGL